MTKTADKPRFTLTLQALSDEPDGPSAARRMARGLKYLLRSCRLKCVSVLPAPSEAGRDLVSGGPEQGQEVAGETCNTARTLRKAMQEE